MSYNFNKKLGVALFIFLMMTSFASASLLGDLLSYWRLDEVSGVVVDAQGRNNGINQGATRGFHGVINNSFLFRTNDFVDLSNQTNVSAFNYSLFSVQVWFNVSELDTSQFILDNRNNGAGDSDRPWSLQVDPASDTVRYSMTNTTGDEKGLNSEKILANSSYHLVLTHNFTTGNVTLYINGSIENSSILNAGILKGSDNLTLGSKSTPDTFFDGTLDEVGFWINRILSPSDVSALYNGGDGNAYPFTDFLIELLSPLENSQSFNKTNLFNITVTPFFESNMTNATLNIWFQNDSNIFVQETNSLISPVKNNSNFSIGGFDFARNYLWNVEVCGINLTLDTVCSIGAKNFTLKTVEVNETFSLELVEGQNAQLTLDLSFEEVDPNINAILTWNNTEFSAIKTSNNTNVRFVASFPVPGDVGSSTGNNITHQWNYFLSNNAINDTTSPLNQTVFDLGIDDCSANTNRLFNFTVVDEEIQTFLPNATIDISVNIYNLGRDTLIANFSTTGLNPQEVCLSTALFNGTSLLIDTDVKYQDDVDPHAVEFYIISNQSLSSSSTNQNITLFDLNLTDSTSFLISVTGLDFLPLEGASIFLERQYIAENVFKTVELPRTDPNGQTILHLVRDDVVYNIRLVKGGVILQNFEGIRAFCEDPLLQNCQLSFAASSSIAEQFDYDLLTGLAYSSPPVFDSNTSTISFNFIVPTGEAKTVVLNVSRNDVFGNRTLCQTSLTSASGTLSCSIDPGISDTRLKSIVTVDGVTALLSSLDIDVSNFGPTGYMIWFIMTLLLVLIFGDSKIGVLSSLLISYVGAALMGISRDSVLGIGGAGIWIITITILGIWRLSRDKPQ